MVFGPFGATHPWPCPQGLHQHSECVPPVFIHRAITFDIFKFLAQKASEELCDNQKKEPKSYFLTSSDRQTCPRGKHFAPLYSTLHYLRFDMQHDYVQNGFWTFGATPSGPAHRAYIKIRMCSSKSSSIGLLPVTVSRPKAKKA